MVERGGKCNRKRRHKYWSVMLLIYWSTIITTTTTINSINYHNIHECGSIIVIPINTHSCTRSDANATCSRPVVDGEKGDCTYYVSLYVWISCMCIIESVGVEMYRFKSINISMWHCHLNDLRYSISISMPSHARVKPASHPNGMTEWRETKRTAARKMCAANCEARNADRRATYSHTFWLVHRTIDNLCLVNFIMACKLF